MKKSFHSIFHTFLLTGLLLAGLTACQDDFDGGLTPEQRSLIGRAINFNTSAADAFTTRSTAYTDYDDGSFNQNDRMRIYRNYWDAVNGKWADEIGYRTYCRNHDYAADIIFLGADWRPEKGRQGYDDWGNGTYTTKTQTEADSLTWQNGATVRFRAWSRSNYHNVLRSASNTYYYPDFCYSGWVNASGPTTAIPLVMRHLGSRLRFVVRQSGNEFDAVEISTQWEDYKYADNADTKDHDNSNTEASKSDEQAKAECKSVTDAYNRMCMPAGVDMQTGNLLSYLKADWEKLTDAQVQALEDQPENSFYKYGTKTPAQIASDVKRPFFSIINGQALFVTIPYDMSNEATTQGDVLTLPACTRFRVYIHDTNKGDQYNTPDYEGKYHIFSLSDIKDENGNTKFPNGLKLSAGVSYRFNVGYRYGKFTVTVDNDLSWVRQDMEDAALEEQSGHIEPNSTPYGWWKDAIADAIPKGTEDFNPTFTIHNEAEFLEFIKLVNGTAAKKTSGLYHIAKKKDAQGNVTEWGWSTTNSTYNPQWITEEEAEKEGFIFYDRYYAANADRPAYSERDYLRGPYSFYDENLNLSFQVKLDKDLDLRDTLLTSVGNTAETPFEGDFNGQMHTISHVNMSGEYIFKHVSGRGTGASVTNLKVESLHPTGLIDQATGRIYIAGISMLAPVSTNSIARSITTSDATMQSYVVGCIHVGDAGGALVGTASNLNMFGCMQAAAGIGSGKGALLGGYASGASAFFAPTVHLHDVSQRPTFQRFMCNYYDTQLSSGTNAVGSVTDDYSLFQYIRGVGSYILCAHNDLFVDDPKLTLADLLKRSDYRDFYGLAPWRAMNYAIYYYNLSQTSMQSRHQCQAHYEPSMIGNGYGHRYPTLVIGDPATKYTQAVVVKWNPVIQTN